MNPVYFTPSFNAKPCFLFYTLFKQQGQESYCDPTCGSDGVCYSQSFLHIGAEGGQNYCDNDTCTLHNFWLFASQQSGTGFEYFRTKWLNGLRDKDNRQIYMGETSNKFMWLSPYYFGVVDGTTTSFVFEPSTRKIIIFSNTTSNGSSISYKDSIEIISNSAKSGLECYRDNTNTVKLQSQASGGILEMKSAQANVTTTTVWASDDNAGLSVVSSQTADIQFNTSLLTSAGASTNDTFTFRNIGTANRKFIVASTTATVSLASPIYIDDKKFVRKSFSVCVEGVTKTIEFLAHEPGVDV